MYFTGDMFNIKTVMDGDGSPSDTTMFAFLFQMLATETLQNENVQNLLADKNQQFDMVIAEWMFNEMYSG